MAKLKVDVPDRLKNEMSKAGWVDWSKVASRAISERLEDIKELKLDKKIVEVSEIPADDKREIKEALARAVVRSSEKTLKDVKSGRKKPMNIDEFNELCDKL